MNCLVLSIVGLPLAAGLASCAGAATSTVVESGPAVVADVPLSWFAETYGPYDASLVGPVGDGPGGRPLLLIDGVQPEPSDPDVEALVRESARLLTEAGPNRTDRIRDVRVYKHRCDTSQLGAAGAYGAIMIFRADYSGPMPEPWHSFESDACRG